MPNTKEGELLSKLAMLPATYAREYLDLIQLLLEQLGLDAEDPRLAITIPKHRRTRIRVNINFRVVLSLEMHKQRPEDTQVVFLLPRSATDSFFDKGDIWFTFKQSSQEKQASIPGPVLMKFPIREGIHNDQELQRIWLETVKQNLTYARKTKQRALHNPAILRAAMDVDYREEILERARDYTPPPEINHHPALELWIREYMDYCARSPWLSFREKYKFDFARSVQEQVDLETQSDAEIIAICTKEGQKVNFIQTHGRRGVAIIDEAVISLIRKLDAEEELTDKDITNSPVSATLLSSWLGTLVSDRFFPYANTEILKPLDFIFPQKVPKQGAKAFQTSQELMYEISSLMENSIEQFIPVLIEKLDLISWDDRLWPWVVQDFLYYFLRCKMDPGPQYWWVNQDASFEYEKAGNFVFAAIDTIHHHKAIQDLREVDRLLHYVNGRLMAHSVVTREFVEAIYPVQGVDEEKKGWMVQTKYHLLKEPIPLEEIQKKVKQFKGFLPDKQSPFNRELGINHGYLFSATEELFHLLLDEPNYWVFQGNPSQYDIAGSLRNGQLATWMVKAHKSAIRIGDKVILWVSGSGGGCFALATVASEVYHGENEPEELAYYLEEDPEPHTDRVKISIDYNLVNSPITREELARYPEFAGLKIGNQGTNFSATQSQYDKMETLAKQKNSRLNTQNDQTVLPYLNTIFFGPPGTGKTYRLKENFFDLFTEKGKHESSRIFRDLIKKGLLSKFEE